MSTSAPLYTPLAHRALVAVHGEDRIGFLQGLVSNDMARVQAGEAIWAAFLTPQGKFLHEFFAIPSTGPMDQSTGACVFLDCERARRDDLITRLSRYKLRAKVTLAADDSLTPGVAWGAGAAAAFKIDDKPGTVVVRGNGVAYTDPRLPAAGVRWALSAADIAKLATLGHTQSTPEGYDLLRYDLGLPDGSRDMEIEKALLLENGFEELHGVDFKKGCYIGQELTARTHYRALIKKRLMPVTIQGDTPAPGTPLTAGGADAGEMKSAGGGKGLALVRLEAWHKAGGVLDAGDARITPVKPDWMALP